MSDQLRQHPATPRRLEKLRQAGVTPSSSAVSGVVALAVATALAAVAWRPLCGALSSLLANDLRTGARADQMPRLLAQHLTMAGLLIGALAVALALTAAFAQTLVSGAVVRSPWRGAEQRRQGLRVDGPGAVLGLLALVGTAAIYISRLRQYAAARRWSDLGATEGWAALWLRELALLGGLALVHLLWTWAEYLQGARLTHRELRDEQRESEGPWLTRQFAKRRQKGA